MSRFPKVTETFILREILELERQGQQLMILPLIREKEPVVHPEVERVAAAIHYTPFLSLEILKANGSYLASAPICYLSTLLTVLLGNLGSANLFLGALGVVPKSVYFAKVLSRSNVRHVHAHFATHPALSAFIVSKLSGLTFSFTVHAHDIFVHSAMLRQKLEAASFVVSISEFNEKYITNRFPHVENKINVIHCGIDPDNYEAVPRADKSGEFRILSVASLQVYKGIEYLVRACASLKEKIPNLRCTVVGEGPERKNLEALVKSLGLEGVVELIGAKQQSDVTALMQRSDIFVLSSIVAPDGQMEGIPVALMEAMASRLPVVSTKISGIPELVRDEEAGHLVPPKDVEELAAAILELFEDPGACQRMGIEGSRAVRREFDLASNVAKLKTLFNLTARTSPTDDVAENVSSISKLLGATVLSVAPATAGGGDSRVLLARLATPGRTENEVVIKFHTPQRGSNGSSRSNGLKHAENEYRALESLWPAFRNSEGLRVPRPLALDVDSAAVVTERCTGVRLDRLLRDKGRWYARDNHELDNIFNSAGNWLAKFQSVTRSDRLAEDSLLRLREEFASDLDACKEYFDSALLTRVGHHFERNFHLLESQPGPVVSEHCDFGPHNIFVDGERVTLIDFEGMRDGFIYADLTYFLCILDMMPFYRAASAQKSRWREAFARGYGSKDLDAKVREFFVLPTIIKMAAHNPVLRSASPHGNLRRYLQLNAYTKRLKESLGGSDRR